jgi:hypothetical protein
LWARSLTAPGAKRLTCGGWLEADAVSDRVYKTFAAFDLQCVA